MGAPHFHGSRKTFAVSDALDEIGDALTTIRREDGLSWRDMGRILGKSDDRAADYANGRSEMPVSAFLLACREWNGRFANRVLSMIGMKLSPNSGDDISDMAKLAHVLKLAHLLSAAIADDKTPGIIDADELEGITTSDLDDAERAIAALRARKAGNTPFLRGVA